MQKFGQDPFLASAVTKKRVIEFFLQVARFPIVLRLQHPGGAQYETDASL